MAFGQQSGTFEAGVRKCWRCFSKLLEGVDNCVGFEYLVCILICSLQSTRNVRHLSTFPTKTFPGREDPSVAGNFSTLIGHHDILSDLQ